MVPEKILKDFRAVKVLSGDAHNVAISKDGKVYSWGGQSVSNDWAQ